MCQNFAKYETYVRFDQRLLFLKPFRHAQIIQEKLLRCKSMHCWRNLKLSKNSQKSEKIELKKFQTHMCDFLFGNSFLTLNYKYNQVTSSAKIISNSHSTLRCRPKEYPPQSELDWGGYSAKWSFGRDLS